MLPSREFAILKFEPHSIQLIHKPTKKVYHYQELPSTPPRPELTHSAMLRPITYNNGLLYARGKSTLEDELEQRRRAHNPQRFTEEEILNTIKPVVECLSYIHQQGITHGGISPSSIVVTDE